MRSPTSPLAHGDAYAFGQNWQRFLTHDLTPAREQIAQNSITSLIGDVQGKIFYDIGAGSGLFSLSAYRLGAGQVLSIDVDPYSVACCRALVSRAGDPANWSVIEGSILDRRLITQLERADIVYSWGVLHHTGAMYDAIVNAAQLVKPGGLFCIAIYNRGRTRLLTSERWREIKRLYNRSPRLGQVAMEWLYAAYCAQGEIRRRKRNFLSAWGGYQKDRGMAFWSDVRDWLGGYPYEFATAGEVVGFVEAALGMHTVKVIEESPSGFGNNQFLFRAPAAAPGPISGRT